MAEIIINKEEVDGIIRGYSKENNTFIIKSTVPKSKETTYKFCLNHNECCIKVYYKDRTVKLFPLGKNVETAKLLIDYIASFGVSSNIETYQVVVEMDQKTREDMYHYLEEDFNNFIKYERMGNVVRLRALNGEWATINEYSNKIMIQTKPLIIFGILTTYIAENTKVNIESILQGLNSKNSKRRFIPIGDELKKKLGEVYLKLDEVSLKTLTSSIQMLRIFDTSNIVLEDYTGCITGVFKFLESYLKSALIKFGYEFKEKGKKSGFYMFNKDEEGRTFIETKEKSISDEQQVLLVKLFRIFSNKRNVYLHGSFIPDQTAIISNITDAEDICNETIECVASSYRILMES